MNIVAVILVYAGLVVAAVGAVSVIKPLRFLRIPSRLRGLAVIAAGLAITVLGCLLPASETRIAQARAHLDEFMPAYQFNELHSIRVAAPRERVYRAIQSVTADEIALFRTLTWMRRFGRPGPPSILNPEPNTPMVNVALRSGFILLAEEPGHEMVLGTVVVLPRGFRPNRNQGLRASDFTEIRAPGFGFAAMNFLVEETSPGQCTVTTETRIYATDASARRRFGVYWRVIYPGSALIRRMWLRAIQRRAEGQSP